MKQKNNKTKLFRCLGRRPYASLFFTDEGFTLMELLVSVAVIAAIAGILFLNAGTVRNVQNLNRAAQQLALDIRRAQNLSLAPSDVPNCLYGLKINSSTTYFIYRRPTCPDPRSNPNNNNYGGDAVNIDSGGAVIAFPGAIRVLPYNPTLDVSFEAPEPITFGNGNANASLTVTLQDSGTGMTKAVVINRFGNVEIQ